MRVLVARADAQATCWDDKTPMFYADRFPEAGRSVETSAGASPDECRLAAMPDGSCTTIRAGTVADLGALETIERRAFTCNRIGRRSFARFLSSSQAALMIADHAGSCTGYALLLFRSGSQIARLYSIAVDRTNMQRGIGTALLGASEKKASNRGSTTLRLEVREDNCQAIGLYQKCGFRIFGYHSSYYEDGAHALRLQKELTGISGRKQRETRPNDSGLAIHGL